MLLNLDLGGLSGRGLMAAVLQRDTSEDSQSAITAARPSSTRRLSQNRCLTAFRKGNVNDRKGRTCRVESSLSVDRRARPAGHDGQVVRVDQPARAIVLDRPTDQMAPQSVIW